MICLSVFQTFRFDPSFAVPCTMFLTPASFHLQGSLDPTPASHRKLCTLLLTQTQITAMPMGKLRFTQLPAPPLPSGPLHF